MKTMMYMLQLSSVRDGEYYPLSDSNYNFAKNLLTGIRKKIPSQELKIIACFPKKINAKDENEVIKFLFDLEIHYFDLPITTSVFGTRYDFNYDYAFKNVFEYEPDFIFENNPVHVRAWKTVLNDLKIFHSQEYKKDTKLITYFHWIDSPLFPKVDKDISYWLRQIEGVITADYVLFNSNYAKEQIIESFKETIFSSYYDVEELSEKFHKIPPSFDKKILKYKGNLLKTNDIIFNHRLSSLLYYKKNFENLKDMLQLFLDNIDYCPKVYFTNPSRKQVPDFPFPAEFLELNEQEYYKLLGSNKVGIAPNFFFDSYGMWSIATMEAGVLGNAVIMPKKYGYAEMAPSDYEGFYTTSSQAYQLFEKCIIDKSFREKLVKVFMEYSYNFLNDVIAAKLIKILNL